MEMEIPSFTTLFSFLLFVFMILRIWKIKNSTKILPPGPWKLPVIGSMHHLIGSLPHRRLKDLAEKYGAIMHLQLGELTNIVITSPESAKEIMKTHDLVFANRPYLHAVSVVSYNFSDIAFAPYGKYWRQMRKICTLELLSAKRVESFRSIREEEISKVIRSISCSAGSPINFSRIINYLTYNVVSRTAVGKIWEGEDLLIRAVKDLAEAAGGFSLADLYPSVKILRVITGTNARAQRLLKVTDEILQSVIDKHRARKAEGRKRDEGEAEDLVDVLLNFQENGNLESPLTDDNLKGVLLDTFGAGTDTSTATVEWAMSEMLKNPRVMEKAQEEVRRIFGREGNIDESRLHELHYLKLVIKESLRLHPPLALLLPRECRENCVINSYTIPVKSKVVVNVWAIGRDPKYWTEPEKFYPERFLDCSIDYKGTHFEYLPFGAGRRICPGILFGMANVLLPLAQLLYHFDWKLPAGVTPENLDMLEVFGAVVKRKNELHLIPIPYFSSSPVK